MFFWFTQHIPRLKIFKILTFRLSISYTRIFLILFKSISATREVASSNLSYCHEE
ncbi:unknown protein [Cronobacter turicensis z3032]|uniref:Uncharacterized protein n=1 Tax=Cronobacter turicensis (strain DSM 18703 / CCUG 55852 / LMG 23827 / z3032) TaxID=693216 RepID=C9XTQ7_CROTZ|nr:unknown protein [Cronobacter turicensis z3032]